MYYNKSVKKAHLHVHCPLVVVIELWYQFTATHAEVVVCVEYFMQSGAGMSNILFTPVEFRVKTENTSDVGGAHEHTAAGRAGKVHAYTHLTDRLVMR